MPAPYTEVASLRIQRSTLGAHPSHSATDLHWHVLHPVCVYAMFGSHQVTTTEVHRDPEGPPRSTEVHRGPERSTEVHRGPERSREVHRDTQRSTEGHRGPQRSTKVHRGPQRSRRSTEVHRGLDSCKEDLKITKNYNKTLKTREHTTKHIDIIHKNLPTCNKN